MTAPSAQDGPPNESGCDSPLRHFLDGPPIAEIHGDDLEAIKQKGSADESLASKIARHYSQTGNSKIDVAGIGLVHLDLRSVRNSRGHGSQYHRLAAFLAVPEILRKGRLIDARPMNDAPEGKFYHFAAPIQINGLDYIGVVQIKSPPPPKGITRMYVHQVIRREQLRHPNRAITAAEAAGQESVKGDAGVAETLLRRLYAVKPPQV